MKAQRSLAVEFNRVLRKRQSARGTVNLAEVLIACGAVVEAYVKAVPDPKMRDAIVERFISTLRRNLSASSTLQ